MFSAMLYTVGHAQCLAAAVTNKLQRAAEQADTDTIITVTSTKPDMVPTAMSGRSNAD